MSVKKHRGVWEVRWREGGRGSKARAKSFERKEDALAFDADVRRRKRLGTLTELDAGKETLGEFAEVWTVAHAIPNLERRTQLTYARVWDTHIEPRLGDLQLRALTPAVVADFRARLHAAGVGDAMVLKALVVLQSVMSLAVARGRVPTNPVAAVRKPRQAPKREVAPLPPATVERIRAALEDLRDRTLVSILAYAGLRPAEALALHWSDVRKRTLLVARAAAFGEAKATKTRGRRTVNLLGPVVGDLAEYRLSLGGARDRDLIFPRRDGRMWQEHDYRNWRRRRFQPAAKAAGLEDARPYDLRKSFVSLLIFEGRSVVDVARQAGHSAQTCLGSYADLFDEAALEAQISAEDAIRAARDELGREAV